MDLSMWKHEPKQNHHKRKQSGRLRPSDLHHDAWAKWSDDSWVGQVSLANFLQEYPKAELVPMTNWQV